jgi:GMP synthase (glutamine-hydrolysing)
VPLRPPDIHAHRILILDFGAQYTQLIARRVRESGVYCEILPWDAESGEVRAFGARGVILSGGPESVTDSRPPAAPPVVFELGVPVLGICYGMQTMAQQLGGRVTPSGHREFGYAQVTVTAPCRLLEGLRDHDDPQGRAVLDVWMSHGDRVDALPPGFVPVGASANAPLAAMADESRCFYAVQFHPEVTHTLQGARIIERFVREICGCEARWQPGNIIADAVARVREQVGGDRVLLGLSGGVDSSVVAALLNRAIGDQLVCVFVDHGLLRAAEGDQVMTTLGENMGVRVIRVNAEQRFLDGLRGVADPEDKRKIIGRLFVEVFEEEASKAGDAAFLAQGTLYPDVIESISHRGGPSVTIKSHHNVGGLPERMKMKLLEPLRELFKDEVRALGRTLGLPEHFVTRHPFPGPGLAIRVPGEVTREKLSLLRKADAIFLDEIRKAGLYDAIWQAFAVLLPVRTVGVMGDDRTYESVLALRAVTSTDGMTADSFAFDHAFLASTATRIINEIKGINRVVYDVTSKPPGTIEWE